MEEKKQTFNAPEIKLHFLDYWRIIRIRKTVIIAVFLLVAITTTLVTFILPESYSSLVRIRVDKDVGDVSGLFTQERTFNPFDPYWVETEFQTIQSKSILYQVITNLGLNRTWAEKFKLPEELSTDLTFSILKRQIQVSQTRNTSLIEIKVFSEDPQEAADIANEIAVVYRESRLAQRLGMAQRGVKALKAQWEEQDKLVKAQQTLVDKIKTEKNIPDFDVGGGGTYYTPSMTMEPETLRRLEQLRVESSAEYHKLKTLYDRLSEMTPENLRKALVTASQDTQLPVVMEQLALAERRLADLSQAFSAQHPEIKGVQEVIAVTTRQVNDRVTGIMEGLKAKVDAQKAGLDSLQSEVNQAKTNDVMAAIDRRDYFLAKRDLESLQRVRESLKIRIIQEEVNTAIPTSGIVEVIDPAEPGKRAVRPNKPLNIALGILVGLAIGVGLAFFIEYLDTSVKTIDDVERALQAPVLGVIPQNVGILVEEGPDSPHAEAYRVLRTNILFSQKDPKLNTITIVSGGAGEGKSTTTFNLATIFAQNGQRVLVVDSDLRRPSLHKMLRVSNAIGLTNYLLKQNTLEEVIQTTRQPTLDFMPSGKLPSSSMGVLSSQQMKDLIRDLKRRYDYVFFDSPPIMGVSDASILASEVDMVLQVIQYRRYPQPMTIRAKQMIEKVGGNLLGIVLNNINMASDENYYYYSGYYYDYYSKSEEAGTEKPKDAEKDLAANERPVEIQSKY
ncbi:MAG: polysaccharide biosynthesis tyrosine autokinase [Verrucomicrobia bacterium]|nr:polysaccharide biosynthesis tyrosine autokinase [Verrucomicrobiota bacterium]